MIPNNYTLLYVEDDKDLAELTSEWLGQQGYSVICAATGGDAVRAAQIGSPDLVLLDIMLPDMTGFEVLRQLRRLDASLPVIFLTSLTDSTHAIQGLQSGACDYIRKDMDLREIDIRIRTTLARTGHRNAVVPITDDSSIDLRKRQIVVRSHSYRVSYKCIQLLQLLVQHRNTICSRENLVGDIWGEKCINGDLYLNQAISTLRRILSDDPHIALIAYRNSGIALTIDREPVPAQNG